MANIDIGKIDKTALNQIGTQPKKRRGSDGKWELTYEYVCLSSLAESLVPADGAACPHASHTDLDCTNVTIDELGDDYPGIARVVVEYTDPASGSSWTGKAAGDTVKESSSTFREVPITDSSLGFSEGVIADQEAQGIRVIIQPVVTYSYTQYLSSFTWTEANVIASVGQRATPTGMSSPTANKWLMSENQIREQGDIIEQRQSWIFNPNAWDTDIYGP